VQIGALIVTVVLFVSNIVACLLSEALVKSSRAPDDDPTLIDRISL
jgi:hypothetical protein